MRGGGRKATPYRFQIQPRSANDATSSQIGTNIVEVRCRPSKATGGMNQLDRVSQIRIGVGGFVFHVVVYDYVIQSVAPSVGIEVSPIDLREPDQIEPAIARFAQRSNGGIIFTASAIGGANVNSIIAAAARYKLPDVYNERAFVAAGGLISYGPNFADQFRRAADYVDRILKGEKPADLPVQAPNKYELAVNLKTAKALGLSVPQSLLGRADEVIE